MSKQAILLDSSILNDLESCPTRLELRHNQHLIPVIKEHYFEKGDLFHKVLALWRRLQVHRPNWDFEKRLNLCLKKMDKMIVKMNADLDELEDEKSYFKFYVSTKYRSDSSFETISIEKPFIKRLYECDEFVLFWTGQPDWIFCDVNGSYGVNGKLYPLDTKTGSRDAEPSKLSNQFIGYCYSLEVDKLIVDKVNFYKIPDQTSKKFDEWADKAFKRRFVTIDEHLKNRWYNKLVKRAHEYYKFTQTGIDELTDTNYTSCDKYSGCIFKKICEAVPADGESVLHARQFIKYSDFKVEKWDVTKILQEI